MPLLIQVNQREIFSNTDITEISHALTIPYTEIITSISVDGLNYTLPGYNTTVVASKSLGFNIVDDTQPYMYVTYYENGEYLMTATGLSDGEYVFDFENNKYYTPNGEYNSIEFDDGVIITDFSKISGVCIS